MSSKTLKTLRTLKLVQTANQAGAVILPVKTLKELGKKAIAAKAAS